jgi:hypothetical protein
MRFLSHPLARRLPWVAASLLLAAALYGVAGRVAALGESGQPTELSCPRGQTVWLQGQSGPGTPLLAYFAGQPVGGGLAGPDGSWSIPLAVQEKPGRYPVLVVDRQAVGLALASFTCYVDLPVGTAPTEAVAVEQATPPIADMPADLPAQQAVVEPSPTTMAATSSAGPSVVTPTADPALPTATVAPDLPAATPEGQPTAVPMITPGLPMPAAAPELAAVQPHTPGEPELFEYVVLENLSDAPLQLVGWTLAHGGTGELYPIATTTLAPAGTLVIWSGSGQDDVANGLLYWPSQAGRWNAGDTVELRSPDGQVRDSLAVPAAMED